MGKKNKSFHHQQERASHKEGGWETLPNTPGKWNMIRRLTTTGENPCGEPSKREVKSPTKGVI